MMAVQYRVGNLLSVPSQSDAQLGCTQNAFQGFSLYDPSM
jgi:hypothetical protein